MKPLAIFVITGGLLAASCSTDLKRSVVQPALENTVSVIDQYVGFYLEYSGDYDFGRLALFSNGTYRFSWGIMVHGGKLAGTVMDDEEFGRWKITNGIIEFTFERTERKAEAGANVLRESYHLIGKELVPSKGFPPVAFRKCSNNPVPQVGELPKGNEWEYTKK